jgi:hypothetical protein
LIGFQLNIGWVVSGKQCCVRLVVVISEVKTSLFKVDFVHPGCGRLRH